MQDSPNNNENIKDNTF